MRQNNVADDFGAIRRRVEESRDAGKSPPTTLYERAGWQDTMTRVYAVPQSAA